MKASISLSIFLILSLSLLAYKYKSQVSTASKEAVLFEKIDLQYPGLQSVQEAVEKGDYLSAKKQYIAYLRKKNSLGKQANSSPSTQRLAADSKAEQALRNLFTFETITHQFPKGQINWQFNPTDRKQNPNYTGTYQREWTVLFNRMSVLRHLGAAYQQTANPIYVKKVDELINDWIQKAAVKFPGNRPERWRSSWRSLEAGLRAGEEWPVAWQQTIQCPALADSTIFNWITSWITHGEFLAKHTGQLNWLATESHGLYTIGALFPEFKQSTKWRNLAIQRISQQMGQDFYPDGAHVELSPEYHRIAIEAYMDVLLLAQENDYPIEQTFRDQIETSLDYLLKINLPNRYAPRLNDSGPKENLRKLLQKKGLACFPNRADYQWLASKGMEGQPPAFTSVQLPWAGQLVMRNDWSPTANYLLFEYGPYGVGRHQHEDKLGIHLALEGELLVFEAGRENYGKSARRQYALSSQAHSMLSMDQLSQNREAVKAQSGRAEQPYPVVWTDSPLFDYAKASYGRMATEKYGDANALQDLGHWDRHILFLKPDAFFILDDATPADQQVHRYHANFHLNAQKTSFDSLNQRWRVMERGRPSFFIQTPADQPLNARVLKGQESPEIAGWEFFSRKVDQAIPLLRFEKSEAGPIEFAYLFTAAAPGQPNARFRLTQLASAAGTSNFVVEGTANQKDHFQIIIATADSIQQIEFKGKRYPTKGILIKDKTKVYDLLNGRLLSD